MRVAVSASSPHLESPVDPRFGRCAFFLMVDPASMEFEAVENPHVGASSGAGIQAAQLVAQKNVEAVLTGSCGPNAFETLKAAGVKVIVGVTGNISEAVKNYASGGTFQEAAGPDVPPHFGMGRAAVGGGGRGRGMAAVSPEEELTALKEQAEELRRDMDRISGKINALENRAKKKSSNPR